MPRSQAREEWISSTEALDIINTNSERTDIGTKYLYLLVKAGRVEKRPFDKHTFEYKKSDILGIRVKKRGKKGEESHVSTTN